MIIFANVAESFAPLTFVSIYGYGGPCSREVFENVRDDQTMLFSGTKEKFGFFEFCFDLWL